MEFGAAAAREARERGTQKSLDARAFSSGRETAQARCDLAVLHCAVCARFVGVILSLFPRKFALVRCCPPRDEGGCALPVAIIPFSAPASWRRSSSRATSQGRPRPYSPCGVTPHRPGLRWPARSPAAAPPAPAEQPPFWALLYASLVRAPADNPRRCALCGLRVKGRESAGRSWQDGAGVFLRARWRRAASKCSHQPAARPDCTVGVHFPLTTMTMS